MNVHPVPNSPGRAAILSEIVSHQDFNIFTDVFADVLFERSRTNIIGMEETRFAAALPNADHDFFATRSTPALAMRPTANAGLIHLDYATQFWLTFFDHCGPDAMAWIPRGPIGLNFHGALNLASNWSPK